MAIIDIISVGCIILGLFFFLGTNIGLLRFPDFYSRMHAAGKGDTLSSILVLTGLAVYNLEHLSHDNILGPILVSIKIIFICVFIFISSPTATHAIMDAGFEANVDHWSNEAKDEEKPAS